MKYLLSIVIPTKNRYKYLKDCIKTLTNIDSKEMEIVIQDNSDNNSEIVSFLKDYNNNNIKYYYETGSLSQTENSDKAVEHASGKYICFIGDDDSISKYSIEIVKYMEKNNIKACVNDVATYHWPDIVYEGKKQPALTFDKSNAYIKQVYSKKILDEVLKNGLQDIKMLARVYHAFIHKDILLKIKEKTGTYFPGPSPDMANAIACTLSLDKYIYVHLPLVISGYSYKSAGGMGLRGEHKGSLKNAKQLPKDVEKKWNYRIPKIWLGYTMWPESGLEAFSAMGHSEYEKKMNYYAMYAKGFLRYKEYRKIFFEFSKFKIYLLIEMVRFSYRWMNKKMILYYKKITNKQAVIFNNIELEEACKQTDEFIIGASNLKKLEIGGKE